MSVVLLVGCQRLRVGAPAGRVSGEPRPAARCQLLCAVSLSPGVGRPGPVPGERPGRLCRGREEDRTTGLRPGAWWPGSGHAALASPGVQGRACCLGVQGGDHSWRIAGKEVG